MILDHDKEFVALSVRSQFIEDVYAAMEYLGIKSKKELARKLGIPARRLTEIMADEVDFTIEEMAEISAGLGFYLHLRMISPEQRLIVTEASDD